MNLAYKPALGFTPGSVTWDESRSLFVCSCGATSPKRGLKRFLDRHPRICDERRRFAKELARGTRSVDADRFEKED